MSSKVTKKMRDEVEKNFKKSGGRLKRWINPSAWMGYQHLKQSADSIRDATQSLFSVPFAEKEEKFDEAVNRLGVKHSALRRKQRFLLFTVFLLCLLAAVAITYGVYQLMIAHYLSFFPSIILGFLCLAVAFRYHFWYFQMKSEKLGCTFQEWLAFVKNCFIGKK